MKKSVILGLIFMIMGLISMLIWNLFISMIFIVASLIISIINLKQKKVIVLITFIGSILLLISSIIVLIVSTEKVEADILKSKMSVYKNYEASLENNAKIYIANNPNVEELAIDNSIILTEEQLNNSSVFEYCDGYVVVDLKKFSYDAYISCDSYQTEGYNEDY